MTTNIPHDEQKERDSENLSTTSSSVTDDNKDALHPITSFLKEHPAIIGTLIYLQVSAVGIIYIWTLLSSFGVNVFDYAEANDFLLAAFKQPLAYFMGMLTVLSLLVQVILLRYRRRKMGRPVRTPFRILMVFIITAIVYTFIPAFIFGRADAQAIIEGNSGFISLQLKARQDEVTELISENKLSIIGTTDKFVFFYDHDCEKCIVIPTSNIGSLSFDITKE